ncbi:MAG: Protein of unknown function DUF1206, partial [uncultured Blastococcus sp.]
ERTGIGRLGHGFGRAGRQQRRPRAPRAHRADRLRGRAPARRLARPAAGLGRERSVGRPVRGAGDAGGAAPRQAAPVGGRPGHDRAGRLAGRRGAALAQRMVGVGRDQDEGAEEVRQVDRQGHRLPRAGHPGHPVRERRWLLQLAVAAADRRRCLRLARRALARRPGRPRADRRRRLPRLQGRHEALPEGDRPRRGTADGHPPGHPARPGRLPGQGRGAGRRGWAGDLRGDHVRPGQGHRPGRRPADDPRRTVRPLPADPGRPRHRRVRRLPPGARPLPRTDL